MSADKKTTYEQQLTASREQLKTLLASLNDEQWETTVVSEGDTWTVQDIVAHLVENEAGMSIHIYKTRQGRETVPEGFDLAQWNAGVKKRMGDLSRDELLTKMDEVRAKTLEGLHSLEEHEWSLQGRHPAEGLITIEQYYQTIAGHDDGHAKDIKTGLGLA